MSTITKDLGAVSAYAYAVEKGYTGTEAEYAELMASYATVAQQAGESAQTASEKAQQASASATSASQSASSASASAQTAQTAQQTATAKASEAQQSAQTATTKAQEASQSASESSQSASTAVQAKQDAQTAKTASETAQASAEGSATTAQTAAQTATQKAAEAAESARTLTIDKTLTQEGQAADAKVVGDEISDVKEDLNDAQDWLGYPKNLFDARDLTVSNTNNWSIDSSTKTSVTITHKNTYGTGFPIAVLNLPTGKYDFHANYADSSTQFSLLINGSWVKALADGVEIDIDSSNTNAIYFSNSVAGTYTITEIGIIPQETTGKIPTIESEISALHASELVIASDVSGLKTGFADIAELDINSLVGIETQKVAINASGAVYAAGSPNYRLVKYDVTAGKKYWISANSNWGNLLWCFYNASDAVVALGQASASESADTIITNTEVIAPVGASYILVAYNFTVAPVDCKTQTGYVLKGKWEGKKWVCVGDSLTAENNRTTKHYFDYVADETGITTVNMGDSGSGYAREQDVGTAFYQRIGDCPTDADVVTIFGSFNDLGAGLPIGAVDDTGTTTLAGCINTTIDNLQAVIPLVNLGIVAPTPWDTTQPATSGADYNYVEIIKAICERRSIPFLDLWRCSNLRPWDADFRAIAYSKDGGSGTHPDETGHKIIAPRFKAFLETLLM